MKKIINKIKSKIARIRFERKHRQWLEMYAVEAARSLRAYHKICKEHGLMDEYWTARKLEEEKEKKEEETGA